VSLGDPASQWQSEPRTTGSCGDQGIEHPRSDFGGHSGTVVGHLDDHALSFGPRRRRDAGHARQARLNGVVVEHVQQAHEQTGVRLYAQVVRIYRVHPCRAAVGKVGAGRNDDLCQEHGLGAPRVVAGQGHEVIDDPVRGSSIPLNLGHVLERPFRIPARHLLPGHIRARRDHLEHVSELMSNLDRDFAEHREAIAHRALARIAHDYQGRSGPAAPASRLLPVGLWPAAERAYRLGAPCPTGYMAAVQPDNKIGIGTVLVGKYRVSRELGRGGMAAVYEAEHVNIGKRVAIKVLAAELQSSAIVTERFFREARAAASVKSPYIVEVYDSGRLEDGRPFIAMELLEGESLYDRMARVRLIDSQATVRIIGQVAKGLTKAHAAGIVHRDLKPENIHLCKGEDGEEIAKLLDFGLAKFYAPVKTDEKTARLTREGAVFGTPAYMSPEQVKGQGTVDHRSDLWALGCMAFECLTGRPVWNTEQGVAMTFAAIAAAQLPVPSRLRPDLPAAFDGWFLKALDRDASKRFQTSKELADELAKALGAPPISLVNVTELEALEQQSQPSTDPSEQAPSSARGSGVKPAVPFAAATSPGTPRGTSDVNLLRARGSPQPSASDLVPITASEEPMSRPLRGWPLLLRVLVSMALLGAAVVGGWFAYKKWIHRFRPPPVVAVGATSARIPAVASEPVPTPPPLPEMPRWMVTIEEGQQSLAAGDPDAAMRKFKDALDAGAGAIAKSFLDQVKLGASTTGPCKMLAFSHPRLGYGGAIGRPAIAVTSKGAVVAWTDDHEQQGHDHVYSVLIDGIGRPSSRPRDLTPEADYAMRPALLSVDDRVVLLFWDKSGREPGVRVRWLDPDGRIGGMSTLVGAGRAGLFWPAMDRAPDGSFWVVWQEGRDKEGEDIFLRHLDAELKPLGPEIRATDYEPEKGRLPRVSVPTVGVSNANVFVGYALERDREHLIERMRVPMLGPDAPSTPPKGKAELGETATVNEEKIGGDYPAVACTRDACYLVWHEIDKGAQAALLDPVKGTLLWRKRFTPRGGHPAVVSSIDGQAAVAYYESSRVRLASISRDGVGTTSTFAKVTGDQPRPWIAPGRAHGEWYVAWLDLEAGHTEAFVARLQCRN
jgi:serine/threonine protein kinase